MVKVRVTLPLEISVVPGVYTGVSLVKSSKVPFPLVDQKVVLAAPPKLPVGLTVEPSHITISFPASTVAPGSIVITTSTGTPSQVAPCGMTL